jgi:hypothetical protein
MAGKRTLAILVAGCVLATLMPVTIAAPDDLDRAVLIPQSRQYSFEQIREGQVLQQGVSTGNGCIINLMIEATLESAVSSKTWGLNVDEGCQVVVGRLSEELKSGPALDATSWWGKATTTAHNSFEAVSSNWILANFEYDSNYAYPVGSYVEGDHYDCSQAWDYWQTTSCYAYWVTPNPVYHGSVDGRADSHHRHCFFGSCDYDHWLYSHVYGRYSNGLVTCSSTYSGSVPGSVTGDCRNAAS